MKSIKPYGYVILDANKKEAAIAIFEINTLAFPKYANRFDSLAEGYLAIDQLDLALVFKKVLLIENENALKILKKLGGEK